MKLVIFLAFVALAAAVPLQSTQIVGSSPPSVLRNEWTPNWYGFFGQQYNTQGNIYPVAQYIAYQFHQAQQLGYTPAQVSQYLIQNGYPLPVAQYLGQQYEAGLSQSYFQSPWQIFQYYQQQGVSQDVQQYIAQQIASALPLLQTQYAQFGQQAFNQELQGVSEPISKFIVALARYYTQNGVTYSGAYYAYQQLQVAERYAQSALQYLANGQVPQQVAQYVIQQLQQGLNYIQQAEQIYLTYQNYQQYYVPYFAAQYYGAQTEQIYQYFLNAYQYIQGQQNVFPQNVIQQIQFAYLSAQSAYYAYNPSQFVQGYPYTFTYGYGYILRQAYQYSQYLLQFIQQQVTAGAIPQQFANYIIEQLELIQQQTQNTQGVSQVNFQQVLQNYQNIWQHVQGLTFESQPVGQFLVQQIRFVLDALQEYYQAYQYYYGQGLSSGYGISQRNYGHGYNNYLPQSTYESQYRQYYRPSYYGNFWPSNFFGYQYGPYSSTYGTRNFPVNYSRAQYGPYSSSYGFGLNVPSTYSGSSRFSNYGYGYQYGPYGSPYVQGTAYTPYQYQYNAVAAAA